MSKYTTEVRFICENYAGFNESKGYADVDEVISKSRQKVFDFSYPIFDEAYRPVLETKILLHYYTREICEETVSLWKLRLKSKMNEIMPYYNKLYESELLQFNPLYDVDYSREGNRNKEDDNTTTNNLISTAKNSGKDIRNIQQAKGGRDVVATQEARGGEDTTEYTRADKYSEWNLYSDTPQGGIEGIIGAENEPSLEDDGYLTNATHIIHDGTGTEGDSTTTYGGTLSGNETTSYGQTNTQTDTLNFGKEEETKNEGTVDFDGTTNEEYAEHVSGRMNTNPNRLLKEFRDNLLNIDMDIIKQLAILFFNLW